MTHPIAKALCLVGAFASGSSLSQYPEFAQQYTQRLAGQVDALEQVVADFDRSALDAGLTRTQALDQLKGTEFLVARQADMYQTFARHTVLTTTLIELREASAMERVMLIHRLTDTQTLQNTWTDFQPAIPVTAAGAVTAGAGFLGGWAIIATLLSLMKVPFKSRLRTKLQPTRRDPPIQHPRTSSLQTPRLMGETRP
jgi:hypothetical protein